MVQHAVGADDVGAPDCAGSRHDARVDADAAGILGEGDVAQPVVMVLDRPVTADDAGKGFRRQRDGGCVEGADFLARLFIVQSRRKRMRVFSSTRTTAAIQRCRLYVVERRTAGGRPRHSGIPANFAARLRLSSMTTGAGDADDVFEATQQGRLIVLDLDDSGHCRSHGRS